MRVILLMLVCVSFSYAQEISSHAIGLRLGSNDGFGTEISYQKALGSSNRLELDLGWRSSNNVDAIKLVGLYQWVWKLEGNFNWYAGFGGGVAFIDAKGFNSTNIVAAGNLGIEYNFNIPLLLSLDIRPEVYIGDNIDRSFGPDIALGIRYQF